MDPWVQPWDVRRKVGVEGHSEQQKEDLQRKEIEEEKCNS